jgi:hypothetical protein
MARIAAGWTTTLDVVEFPASISAAFTTVQMHADCAFYNLPLDTGPCADTLTA